MTHETHADYIENSGMAFVTKAASFAIQMHEGQLRKGDGRPYIIHPIGVALKVASVAPENYTAIAAAFLHDGPEDKRTTMEAILLEFGPGVTRIVDDVTEKDKSLSWRERKEQAIEHVSHMGKGSLLVKAADKLDNLTSLYEALVEKGLDVLKSFNAPLEMQVEMDKKLIDALSKKWPQNPLLVNLREALLRVELFSLSDEGLVDRFNSDVGNPGWIGARARFHSALRQELIRRDIDFSAIGDDKSLSFRTKVSLQGKTLNTQI